MLVDFEGDHTAKLEFWVKKDIVQKMEILLLTNPDKSHSYDFLRVLNDSLEVGKKVEAKGRNPIK